VHVHRLATKQERPVVTNPRTPALALRDDGLFLGCDGASELWLHETLDPLSVDIFKPSATMVTHRIDILTGDVLDGSVTVDAGKIRVVREEAA